MNQPSKSVEEVVQELLNVRSPIVLAIAPISSPEEVEGMCNMLRERECVVAVVRHVDMSDYEGALIAQVAAAFQFPDYFGENWNATDECLADLSWLPSKHYCCIFERSNLLRERDLRVYDLFINIFQVAGESWAKRSVSFKLVLV